MTRRQTIQKQAVLNAVRMAQPSHPTAADVFALVRPSVPSLSIGTVYRVLHGLVLDGVIMEVPHSCGPTRYDGNTVLHHHVICSVCGAVGDVHLPSDLALENCVHPLSSFQIEGFRLEFQGRCPSCAVLQHPAMRPEAGRMDTVSC